MTPPREARRPIAKTKDASGRESYAKEKLAWLQQVACDPQARNEVHLAVVLALKHLRNSDGRCDPGDKTLASDLHAHEREVRRWRTVLIEAGWLKYERRTAGMGRHERANHVLIFDPQQPLDHRTDLSGDCADRRTNFARPPDSRNSEVVDSTAGDVPNQDLNQVRIQESHAKTQIEYRKTTGNAAAIANERAARIAKNMATEDEQRRDCAVLCSAKLLRGYSNAQAGDALGFAEAIEDMFARFPVHIQKEAVRILPVEHPKWMPQPGEVFHVCERLAGEEFRQQRRETQLKQQLEARRADEAAGLPYLRPKAITGTVAAPPSTPSNAEHEARDSLVRAIWRDVADGKIEEAEAQRRIDALAAPRAHSAIAAARSDPDLMNMVQAGGQFCDSRKRDHFEHDVV